MRRLCAIFAGFALIPTGMACQHTAGKCDCLPPLPHCSKYGLFTPEMNMDATPRQAMLPPTAAPRMIPASAMASDIADPVRISPSDGASGFGG